MVFFYFKRKLQSRHRGCDFFFLISFGAFIVCLIIFFFVYKTLFLLLFYFAQSLVWAISNKPCFYVFPALLYTFLLNVRKYVQNEKKKVRGLLLCHRAFKISLARTIEV